jgi:hypothetical protein
VDADCVDGVCDGGTCIPNPPLTPSFQISSSSVGSGICSPTVRMSGFAPDTTYSYRLDLRQVSTGQTGTLFVYFKTTDSFGNATASNRADITAGLYEVKAHMDQYSSEWALLAC